jgi:hypothetical protein
MSENQNEQHENLVPLHNQLLKQNAEDIKELKELTFGLPQTLERIEYVVNKLGENVDKFLDSAEKKFQTKEVCEMCIKAHGEATGNIDKRVEDLEKKWDYFIKTLVGALLSLVGYGIGYAVYFLWHILSHI